MKFAKKTILTVAIAAQTACVTTGKDSQKSESRSLIPQETTVVLRSGKQEPVISNLDRDAWVDVHKAVGADQKFYASLSAGEFKTAVKEAHFFLTKNPKHRGALLALASGYAMLKDFEKARLYAQLLERYHPGMSESLNIQAIAIMLRPQATLMDYRQAAVLFEQAFSMNGSEVAAGLNLGALYLELGNADKASEVLATVKSRCNGCRDARYNLGTALARIGQYDRANSEFQQIVDENPRDAEALYRLALVSKNGYNDISSSKAHLRQLLALDARSSGPVYRQAHIMLRRLEGLDSRKMSAGGRTAVAGSSKTVPVDDGDDNDDGELLPASTNPSK
jgi:tetratricopeptide (TPR) repeat protein